MPVLQLCTARSELGELCVQPGVSVAFDDRLGFVPEPIGMAQIALAQLSLQGDQQAAMGL